MKNEQARKLFTVGNNAGDGYAPYTDDAADDTVEAAIEAAQAGAAISIWGWLAPMRRAQWSISKAKKGLAL
jgi:hypothetical protein